MTEQFLVYATAGLAFGHVTAETSLTGSLCASAVVPNPIVGTSTTSSSCSGISSAAGSLSETRFGGAWGGGLQYALSANWSLKTEYIHWDLGRADYGITPLSMPTALTARTGFLFPTTTNVPVGANISSTASARFNGDIARVSVNYKID